MGLLSATLAKLLWRRDLTHVGWLRLAVVAIVGAAAVSIGGLVILGHDGRMTTYAVMVAVVAVSLWSVGFGPFRR